MKTPQVAALDGMAPLGLMTAAELTAAGYRRVSNKYGIVARIDRADWWEELEKHFKRNMPFRTEGETGRWADYYRRNLTEDTQEPGPEIAKDMPGSTWDPTGYVE